MKCAALRYHVLLCCCTLKHAASAKNMDNVSGCVLLCLTTHQIFTALFLNIYIYSARPRWTWNAPLQDSAKLGHQSHRSVMGHDKQGHHFVDAIRHFLHTNWALSSSPFPPEFAKLHIHFRDVLCHRCSLKYVHAGTVFLMSQLLQSTGKAARKARSAL